MTNKELKFMILALVAVVTVLAISLLNTLDNQIAQEKAINAVVSYINETADTGQMDEFIESPDGVAFAKYAYGK